MAGLGVLFLALASGCGSGCGTPPVVDPDARLMPDAEKSTVVVSKAQGVRANGQESVDVTVTVLQADGKPLAGRTVRVAVSGEGNTVTQSAGTTDPRGLAIATVKSTVAGVKTVTASVEAEGGPVLLTARPSVQFVTLPAVRLAFTTSPQQGTAGTTLGVFEVTVQDAEGNAVTDSTAQVTLAVGDGPTQAQLQGVKTAMTVNGVARFPGLWLEKAGQGFTLVATAQGLTSALSTPFTIAPAVAHTMTVQLPAFTPAGGATSADVTVLDVYGNVAAGYTGTVRFTSDDAQAVLPGNYTFTAADKGKHTFDGLTLKRAGARQVTVKDVATAFLFASREVSVVAGPPTRLLFSQQPANGSVRTPFGVAVSVLDAWDNRVLEGAPEISLSVSQANVTLEGNRTAVPVDGLALFTGLSIPEDGTGYTLRAAGTTLAPVTSTSFNIVDAVAPGTPVLVQGATSLTRLTLTWTAVGDDGLLGTASSYDLRVSSAPITAANFSAATPVATGTPKAAGGAESARISSLSPKSTYHVALKVTDNAGNSSLATQVVSTQDPDAARLVFLQPLRNGKAGVALQPIQLALQDVNGNLLDDATSAVTLAVQGAPEFGPFTVAAVGGVATFENVRIDKVGTGYTLKATSGALAPVTSTAFSVSHGDVAALELTVPSSPVTAGTAFNVGLRVSDAFGNAVTDYSGTVHFTSGDAQAELPADYTFAPSDLGLKTLSLTLKTADAQTVTVADTANAALTATKTVTVRNSGASTLVLTGLPASVVAGSAVGTFLVEARDAHGNRALDYAGTVHVTSSDAKAVLPADLTFAAGDQGRKSFSATLKTAGSQTVTVTDTLVGTLTASAGTTVQPGPVASLVLAAPASASAGSPVSVTVTAHDAFGNTVVDYGGTVHFTSDDAQAELPADYTFASSDQGSRQFTVTLKTAKAVQVSVADGASALSVSATVQVAPAAAVQLKVTAPESPVTAGTSFPVELVLEDTYGNVATGYTGTVFFSSGDGQAVLPADYTFVAADAGRRSFSVTLKTAGARTVTVADTVNGMLTATKTVTVRNSAASTLVLTGLPASVDAGVTVSTLQVEARDAHGNRALDYTGTVHFTSGDTQAVLPSDTAFTLGDQGLKGFSATLKTAGSQTVTVTDTLLGTLTASAGTTVLAGAVKSLVLAAPASATAGSAVTVTVTARDDFGNTAVGYGGTVHFASDDAQAELPVDYSFGAAEQGTHSFSVTLKTAKTTQVTVSDESNGLSVSASMQVAPAAASLLTMTVPPGPFQAGESFSVALKLEDAHGNVATGYTGTVHFTSDDAQAELPADYTFVAADAGLHSFPVKLKTAGNKSLSVKDLANASLSASASRQVNANEAEKLVFFVAPGPGTVRATLAPVTVGVADAYGNAVTGPDVDLTLSLMGGSLPTVLSGTLTATTTSGAATFTDLSLDQQGDFQLQAQTSTSSLQAATSAVFSIVDDLPPDAPALTVGSKTSIQLSLSWTAVGDDGVLGAPASSYELRYATNPDLTNSTLVSTSPPEPTGTPEAVTLTGLTPNTLYYFGLTVRDDANNASVRSVVSVMTNPDPCATVTCAPPTVVCSDDGVSRVTTTYSCVDVDTMPMCLESSMSALCPGAGGVCFQGACTTASPPAANALTLTELMHSPTSSTTEYMELLNRTSTLLDITGLQVTYTPASGSPRSFTVSKGPNTAVLVAPNGRVVLAQNRDTSTNGGVSSDYAYGTSFTLDTAGQLQLARDTTVVEEFAYTSAFPQTLGKAMVLSSQVTGTKANAWPWYWCDATSQLSGGDYGSPNAANGDCGVSATAPVDYCAIQFPKTFPDGSYPATITQGTSWPIYTQFYEPSVTNRNNVGNDYYPHVQAELGYGTDTANPAGWTWTAATFNSGFSSAFSNNDELMANLTIPTVGTYKYGFRYRLRDPVSGTFSAWTYCDRDNVTVPPAGNYGSVTVAAATNHVVISELAGAGVGGGNDEFVELYNPTNSPIDLNNWKVQYKSATGPTYTSLSITTATTTNGNTIIPAKGFFLIANNSYIGTVTPNLSHNGFSMSATVGHIRIGPSTLGTAVTDANTVDKVGYGSTADSPEGTVIAAPATAGSIERKAYSTSTAATMEGGVDALKGNSYDSDNNANDFIQRTTRNPQNSSSTTETP